ncbi:RRP12-like protein [Dinothrombium tinctorium]|uniref:RRP12-like protein n=1 Tax=Dinothrombium tinctorium TaxID=1965070 RepID=A0A443QT58_9ACAR|nr:RRP12-like protein [Dinothrombium tinctorium]
MRIAKKATKGKGKQWKRGESSSCNPSTNKFRQKVRLAASAEPSSNASELTTNAIEAHNVLLLEKCSLNADSDSKSDTGTFASLWSNCSNSSFDKLINNWQPSSILHKEMLAVLAAVTEAIRENGGKESETEYFAALIATLDTLETEEALTATFSLLNMVVKRLPTPVLRLKFSDSCEIFRKHLNEYVEKENSTLLRCLISCVAAFLRAQEIAVWNLSHTQQIFKDILYLTTHSKPRVRKAAHKAVINILKGSVIVVTGQVTHHPVSSLTAEFCTRVIEETRVKDSIRVALHMLNLIKDILVVLNTSDIKHCCETILRMMTLGNVLIVTSSFQVFYNFFKTQSKSEALNCELNMKIIKALYDYQPSVNDTQPISAWLTLMKQAHICLFLKSRDQCLLSIPKLVKASVSCWLSDSNSIYSTVEECLKDVINICLRPTVSEISINAMQDIFDTFEKCFSYQYIAAWGSLCNVLSLIFEVFGPQYPDAFRNTLKNLSEMRESYDFKFSVELHRCVASAVKHMGPEIVLNVISLKMDLNDNNFNRSWLLPVLRDSVKDANLGFFVSYFIPLSKEIELKIDELNKSGNIAQIKVYSVLNSQIWSLLPSFCNNPRDLIPSFKLIARHLGQMLRRNSDLHVYILKALRLLISSNLSNETNKAELMRYAKNFLPILLKSYSSKDDVCAKDERLLIFENIKAFLSIADTETFNEQYTNLMKNFSRLKQEEDVNDSFRKYVLLDVLRAFIPCIKNEESITNIYNEIVIPFITNEMDKKSQKKGYQLIEEIIKSAPSNYIVKEAMRFLLKSLSTIVKSAKFAPLRSLKFVIENDLIKGKHEKAFLLELGLKEAISSLVGSSMKTKTAAYDLLIAIVNSYEDISQANERLLQQLENSDGETQSAIISALSKLLNEFKDRFSADEKANLLKRVLNEATHRHFRFKIKELLTAFIRKFGFEEIVKITPERYRKMLRSIRKIEARKTKDKSDKDSEISAVRSRKTNDINDLLEDSSEDEIDDDSLETMKRPIKRLRSDTYIAENQQYEEVLDLLDLDASKKILSTNPLQKKQNNESNLGFKISEDGKLIIEEPNEEKSRGVKRKSMDDEEEEENDEEMVVEKPPVLQYKPGGSGIHRPIEKSSPKMKFGDEYKSDKAAGDMKRKGKPDPFAYVQTKAQKVCGNRNRKI